MYPCPVALLNENFSRLESETHGSILLFTQWKYFAAIVVNFFFFFKGDRSFLSLLSPLSCIFFYCSIYSSIDVYRSVLNK